MVFLDGDELLDVPALSEHLDKPLCVILRDVDDEELPDSKARSSLGFAYGLQSRRRVPCEGQRGVSHGHTSFVWWPSAARLGLVCHAAWVSRPW